MRRRSPDVARRRLLRTLPLMGVAGLLGACSLGNAPRSDFFLLRDAGGPVSGAGGPPIDKVLMVSAMAPPGLYDSDRMVFSGDGLSRSYFQFGYWSERPAQSLQTLAEARLAAAGRFRQVVSSTSGVRGDLLLSLRLDELYLDAVQSPGTVWLGVSAELIDWRDRRLLGRRQFRLAAPMQRTGAPGLAEAASQAMGMLLNALSDWSATAAGPAAA